MRGGVDNGIRKQSEIKDAATQAYRQTLIGLEIAMGDKSAASFDQYIARTTPK